MLANFSNAIKKKKEVTALRYRASASIFSMLKYNRYPKKKTNQIFFFVLFAPFGEIKKQPGVIEVIPVGESLRERELKMIIKCFTGLCQG